MYLEKEDCGGLCVAFAKQIVGFRSIAKGLDSSKKGGRF